MLLFVCLLGLFAPSFSFRADSTCSDCCSGALTSPIEEALGSWHEYARIPNRYEPGFVCTNFTFFKNHLDDVTLQIDATLRLSGSRLVWDAHLSGSPTDDGAYLLKFPKEASTNGSKNRFLLGKSKKWMLFQACLFQHPNERLAWILSKTTKLEESELRQINREMLRWKLRSSMFEKSDNTNCPHYDEIIGKLGKHLASSEE